MGLKRTREQKWEDSRYGELGPTMDIDWTDLINKYGLELPRSGFYAGAGWKLLIESLIVALIAKGWDKQLLQVKEKFGSLRFYVGTATPEMHELIHRAEELTRTTCESCGQSGLIKAWGGGHWIKCFCDDCGMKFINRNNYIREGYDK